MLARKRLPHAPGARYTANVKNHAKSQSPIRVRSAQWPAATSPPTATGHARRHIGASMNEKANFALVGLFVLVLAGAGLGAVLWLSTGGGESSYVRYETFVRESVAGLKPNASVTYRGVPVGRVARIAIDENDPRLVRLLLDVQDGTPVKEDTFSVLKSQGITGLAYLELDGGTPESPLLDVVGEQDYPIIQWKQSLFMRLDTSVSELLEQFTRVAGNTDTLIVSLNKLLAAANIDKTTHVLENVERLTSRLADQVDGMSTTLESMSVIAQNGAAVSAQLPNLTERLTRALDALDSTARAIEAAAGDFRGLASVSRAGMDTFTRKTLPEVSAVLAETRKLSGASRAGIETLTRGTLPELNALLGNTRKLVDSLGRLSKALERNPNILIYGRGGRRGPGE